MNRWSSSSRNWSPRWNWRDLTLPKRSRCSLLLDLPLPPKYPPSPLSPEQQRGRLLATLVELALGTARVQPTVITTEDLHWADPSTLELIQLLVEQGARTRLLLLYTARPEFRVQWPLRAHHTQITLNRLSSP